MKNSKHEDTKHTKKIKKQTQLRVLCVFVFIKFIDFDIWGNIADKHKKKTFN